MMISGHLSFTPKEIFGFRFWSKHYTSDKNERREWTEEDFLFDPIVDVCGGNGFTGVSH